MIDRLINAFYQLPLPGDNRELVEVNPIYRAELKRELIAIGNHFLNPESLKEHQDYIDRLFKYIIVIYQSYGYVDPAYFRGIIDSANYLIKHLNSPTTLVDSLKKTVILLQIGVDCLKSNFVFFKLVDPHLSQAKFDISQPINTYLKKIGELLNPSEEHYAYSLNKIIVDYEALFSKIFLEKGEGILEWHSEAFYNRLIECPLKKALGKLKLSQTEQMNLDNVFVKEISVSVNASIEVGLFGELSGTLSVSKSELRQRQKPDQKPKETTALIPSPENSPSLINKSEKCTIS